VPPIATLLAKSSIVDEYPLVLERLCVGTAPLGPAVEDQLRQRFPAINIQQMYGLTEVTAVCIAVPTGESSNKPGTTGVPVYNTSVKVVDIKTGSILAPYEAGEICLRSPGMMIGYLNNSKATSEVIDKDGWIHTGDLGHFDSDGYFFITDRIKELIKYNGYQVAPAELESVLLSHPDVADAAVIGIQSQGVGEIPMGFVVRKSTSTVSQAELELYVQGKVAPFKRLRGGIRFIETVPKSASGKILRRQLRQEWLLGKL